MASADGAGAPEPGLVFGKLESTEDLGYALRQLRRRSRANSGSKLTYRDLAERTGYSRGAIGNWLTGSPCARRRPSTISPRSTRPAARKPKRARPGSSP
ncbi:MAG TPA: helix-turn-helix transcriptional regulator [Streptosporangiaceae bacterium]